MTADVDPEHPENRQPTVEMCVVRRDVVEPRLHPDARFVTFVARSGGPAAIVLVPVDGGPERQLTTTPAPIVPRGLGGGCHAWLPDGSGVVYAGSDGELWLQPYPHGAPRSLTDVGDGRSAVAPSIAPDGRGVAYVVDSAEVWWRPLGDHDAEPSRLDEGGDDFCFDPFACVVDGSDGAEVEIRWQAWSVPDMPWDGAFVRTARWRDGAVASRGVERSSGAIQQPRRLPDQRRVEVRDDTGWLNLWVDGAPLVDEPFEHAGPSWGPGQRSYAVAPGGDRIAFARNEAGFGRLCTVEVATGAVHEVARGVHGQLEWRGDVVVAARSGARTPNELVAYRMTGPATAMRRQLAVGPVLAWDHVDLVEPEPVEVETEGGTLFARRYPAGQGRLLCWVHGGPTDQWQVEFLPRVAYWRARGWDVLAVDPRGTTGHGRKYQQALHGGWGRLDVDDTATFIRHAHDRGWATPASTIVIGGSSGGLTVLGVLADHDELVAGGVAVYPVTDLADLAERSHRFEAHYTLSLVGPLSDAERYRERSPISRADRVRSPLLVLHGSEDPVVPVDQSIRFVDAARSAGGDVELHVFDGEGHGFRSIVHQRAEYELIGRFLDRTVH